jgi:Collagen triple helix repeat (20 copies)
MHVLLRHARRVMLGVAMGALFLAAAPGTGRAQLVTLCYAPHTRKIVNVDGVCSPPNRAITWNVDGVTGQRGQQGPAGEQGPAGPTGPRGETGPQGPAGPAGAVGLLGGTGATGPEGPAGELGAQGLQGPTGATGPTGVTGPTGYDGEAGTNGVQFYTLGGGDLGTNVELLFGTGFAGILAGEGSSVGTSPIYYGPGNGADTILESEAVPIDASTVTQLWVQTKNVPGPGHRYTFQLCINSVCDSNVTCTIDLPNLTECSDLKDYQHYNPGDTIALEGTADEGAAPTDVSWMVVLHQTGGDIPVPVGP